MPNSCDTDLYPVFGDVSLSNAREVSYLRYCNQAAQLQAVAAATPSCLFGITRQETSLLQQGCCDCIVPPGQEHSLWNCPRSRTTSLSEECAASTMPDRSAEKFQVLSERVFSEFGKQKPEQQTNDMSTILKNAGVTAAGYGIGRTRDLPNFRL